MISQSLTDISIFNLFSIACASQPGLPLVFCQEEQRLDAELAALQSDNPQCQPLPDVSPDEFEQLFTWFIS